MDTKTVNGNDLMLHRHGGNHNAGHATRSKSDTDGNPVHRREPGLLRAQPRPKILARNRDDGHKQDEKDIKLGKEVYLEGDRCKIERYENRVDHLGEDLSYPFGKRPGIAGHDARQKKPEQAGQADPLGDGPTQQPQATHKGQHHAGLVRQAGDQAGQRLVNQAQPQRETKSGKTDRGHQ